MLKLYYTRIYPISLVFSQLPLLIIEHSATIFPLPPIMSLLPLNTSMLSMMTTLAQTSRPMRVVMVTIPLPVATLLYLYSTSGYTAQLYLLVIHGLSTTMSLMPTVNMLLMSTTQEKLSMLLLLLTRLLPSSRLSCLHCLHYQAGTGKWKYDWILHLCCLCCLC